MIPYCENCTYMYDEFAAINTDVTWIADVFSLRHSLSVHFIKQGSYTFLYSLSHNIIHISLNFKRSRFNILFCQISLSNIDLLIQVTTVLCNTA